MKRDRRDREEQRCEVYLRPHLAHAGKDYPEGMSEAAHILILYLSLFSRPSLLCNRLDNYWSLDVYCVYVLEMNKIINKGVV